MFLEKFPYNTKILSDKFPESIPAFIEVTQHSRMKYEWSHLKKALELDRVLHSAVFYPHNYGFIPQTISGDGDPLDVIDLDPSAVRGSTTPVNIIGGLYFKDKKETDIKLIAINPKGRFKDIVNIDDLLYEHSAITEILKLWFLNYKKPGKMVFIKYLNKSESQGIIEKAHLKWEKKFKN